MFVRKAQEEERPEQPEADLNALLETELPGALFEKLTYQTKEQRVSPGRKVGEREKNTRRHEQLAEPHGRGHVAPRTPEQTLNTFMWAVGLMFGLSGLPTAAGVALPSNVLVFTSSDLLLLLSCVKIQRVHIRDITQLMA